MNRRDFLRQAASALVAACAGIAVPRLTGRPATGQTIGTAGADGQLMMYQDDSGGWMFQQLTVTRNGGLQALSWRAQ